MAIDWDGLVLGPVMGAFGEKIVYTPRGGVPIVISDAVFDARCREWLLSPT